MDLAPRELEAVRAILKAFIPEREVRTFGSRVTGTAKPFSDLDLAVMGEQPVPGNVLADLKEALMESALPFKVDVVEWAETGEAFRKIINGKYEVIQPAGRGP